MERDGSGGVRGLPRGIRRGGWERHSGPAPPREAPARDAGGATRPPAPPPTVGEFLDLLEQKPDAAARRFTALVGALAGAAAARAGLPADRGQDWAQDAWIRMTADGARALRRACAASRLSAWLGGVLRNVALEEMRALGRGRRPCEAPRGGEEAARRLRSARAARCHAGAWSALTARQAEALRMHMTGIPAGQVAARLGVSRQAAQQLIVRAWSQLERDPGAADRSSTLTLRILALVREGATYAAAARAAGCTREAARGRVRRARRRPGTPGWPRHVAPRCHYMVARGGGDAPSPRTGPKIP